MIDSQVSACHAVSTAHRPVRCSFLVIRTRNEPKTASGGGADPMPFSLVTFLHGLQESDTYPCLSGNEKQQLPDKSQIDHLNGMIKTACRMTGGFSVSIKRDFQLVELSLVLTGSFRLLLTLQAGADVMLTLLNFSDNALLGAAPLKTAQSALQRLVFLNANFRHCFPSPQ